MAVRLLHHVKIRSKNCYSTSKRLTKAFDLELIASRINNNCKQIVFTAGDTKFVVTEVIDSTSLVDFNLDDAAHNKKENINNSSIGIESGSSINDCITNRTNNTKTMNIKSVDTVSPSSSHDIQTLPVFHAHACNDNDNYSFFDRSCVLPIDAHSEIDSIYDISLEVNDIHDCVKRIHDKAGEILYGPTVLTSDEGSVTIALVKSCVGNVFHTLIDSSQYRGIFLPGFKPLDETILWPEVEESSSKKIHDLYLWADHVTYALHRGTSSQIMSWYEDVFGMKRFFLNRNDQLDTGLVIQGKDIGLRLYAMSYWKCAETGMRMENETRNSFKLVLAESLEGQRSNQIDTFLQEHEGAGVQHIGLATNCIYSVMEKLVQNGVHFMVPPPTYYSKVGKSDDIQAAGEDLSLLRKYGILIDMETSDEVVSKYLMQVFTAPLFERNTFFLEIIQRCGAHGFGAGNVSALWKSVAAYLEQQNSHPSV